MEIINRKPVPIYEVICPECKSTIRYKAYEVVCFSTIKCPVCKIGIWVSICNPVSYEESEEVNEDDRD